jgi:hypothetical protein
VFERLATALPTRPEHVPEEVKAAVRKALPFFRKLGMPASLVLELSGVRYEVSFVQEEYANSRRQYWQARVRATGLLNETRLELPL